MKKSHKQKRKNTKNVKSFNGLNGPPILYRHKLLSEDENEKIGKQGKPKLDADEIVLIKTESKCIRQKKRKCRGFYSNLDSQANLDEYFYF